MSRSASSRLFYYRLSVASRTVAAVLGGYALSAASTAALAVTLPMPRAEAVVSATVFSFLVYSGAVIWAFATRSALRAWLGIAAPTVVCVAVALLGAPS